MNAANFEIWWQEKLYLALKGPALIILDNDILPIYMWVKKGRLTKMVRRAPHWVL